MLATSPYGASSNIALWRAISKPPVELVVADLKLSFSVIPFCEINKVLYLLYHRLGEKAAIIID